MNVTEICNVLCETNDESNTVNATYQYISFTLFIVSECMPFVKTKANGILDIFVNFLKSDKIKK